MKKNLLLVAILLSMSNLHSQPANWIIDNPTFNKSTINSMLVVSDSIILVGADVNNASCFYPALFAYDINGNMLWNKEIGSNVLIKTTGAIISAGYNIGVDDVDGDEFINITKLTTKGDTFYNKVYSLNNKNFVPNSIDFKNGKIVVSSNDACMIVDEGTGNVIKQIELPLQSSINAIKWMDDDLIVLSNKNIYKVDTTGAKIDSLSVTENINDIKVLGSLMYVLIDHALLEYTGDFELMDTLFKSQDIALKKLEQKDFEFNFIGEKNNQLFILKTQLFDIPDTFAISNYFKSFPEIHLISSKQVIMAGNSNSDQVGAISINLDSLPLSNDNLPDIKLKNYFTSDYTSTSNSVKFNVTLTVENVGKVAIDHFSIFAYLAGGMNCSQNYYYGKFENVNLLPNDTFQFVIENISQDLMYDTILCFEALAPNSQLEINTGDNQLCRPFKVSAKNKALSQFKVYPNPFTSYVYVDIASNNTGVIEVFDPVGKIVANFRITGSSQYLDVNHLPAGIYYFRIKTGNNLMTIPVLKK